MCLSVWRIRLRDGYIRKMPEPGESVTVSELADTFSRYAVTPLCSIPSCLSALVCFWHNFANTLFLNFKPTSFIRDNILHSAFRKHSLISLTQLGYLASMLAVFSTHVPMVVSLSLQCMGKIDCAWWKKRNWNAHPQWRKDVKPLALTSLFCPSTIAGAVVLLLMHLCLYSKRLPLYPTESVSVLNKGFSNTFWIFSYGTWSHMCQGTQSVWQWQI